VPAGHRRIGRRPDGFAPTREIWLEHKLAWMPSNPRLEHYVRSSRGARSLENTDA
jgi:hypothetical protein